MWAALLANAASSEGISGVGPGFIPTLRQMSADEARLLNWIYDESKNSRDEFDPPLLYTQLSSAFAKETQLDVAAHFTLMFSFDFGACIDALVAEQLIRPRHDVTTLTLPMPPHSLTHRGYKFVKACRPPKPKS
jgi:hypothetical protein